MRVHTLNGENHEPQEMGKTANDNQNGRLMLIVSPMRTITRRLLHGIPS